MTDLVDEIVTESSVPLMARQPREGPFATDTHSADGGQAGLQRMIRICGQISGCHGREHTAGAGNATHHGVPVSHRVNAGRIGDKVDGTGNYND